MNILKILILVSIIQNSLLVFSQKKIVKIKAHDDWVNEIIFSPDNNYIISGSSDNIIKIWRTDDFTLHKEIKTNHIRIKALDISPDGKTIATGGYDASIKLWDFDSGKELQTLRFHYGHIYKVEFSNDGVFLLSAGYDQMIYKYNLITKTITSSFKLKDWMRDVDFTDDGKYFINQPYGGHMRLWTTDNGDVLNEYKTFGSDIPSPKNFVSKIVYKPRVWISNLIQRNDRSIEDVAISHDNKYILTCAYDGRVKIWKKDKKRKLKILKGGHWAGADRVVFCKSDLYFASSSIGHHTTNICLWSMNKKKPLAKLDYPHVSCITFSKNRALFVAGGHDNNIIVWDISEIINNKE